MGSFEATEREEIIREALGRLAVGEKPRNASRPNPATLQLFFKERTCSVDLPTGHVIVEQARPRPSLLRGEFTVASFVIPFIVGLGLFLFGWIQYRKAVASRTWPAVTGRTLDAKVESETTEGDEDSADSTSYYPAIQYEYEVGSTAFRGTDVAFHRRSYPTSKGAEKALLAYPVGGSVQVFYDPARPARCVLERKSSTGLPLMIIGGLIALAAIVAAVVG